ncbi:gliding motility-associated C-terminal domain-containing protein, partial [Cyclobacteriaceae bacterium]|nr:gliding motility-associated C-terminal domain-containing protein [Cyclobacteriaceae bacterium]
GSLGTTNPLTYVAVEKDSISVQVTDNYTGCIAESQMIYINVLEPISIPNAFTPNGDGVGDVWEVPGLDTYRNASVKIYNRWGQLVFSKTGSYSGDFDGTRNGKMLPVGTYYYVIILNQEGKENLSGDLTIMR